MAGNKPSHSSGWCFANEKERIFGAKTPWKKFKIFTASKGVNEIRLQLYLFFKVRGDTFLHTGPNRLRSPPQKLVFKVKFRGRGGPRGGLGYQNPLKLGFFYPLRRFLEFMVIQQSRILNLPMSFFSIFAKKKNPK